MTDGHRTQSNPLTTTTDMAVPLREIARVPMISAEQYSHVGKYAGALVLACFEQIGGLPRMAVWADQNPADFYTKLMPKVIQRSTAVEHSGTIAIDDAISRLENAGSVHDAEFTDVVPVYDL